MSTANHSTAFQDTIEAEVRLTRQGVRIGYDDSGRRIKRVSLTFEGVLRRVALGLLTTYKIINFTQHIDIRDRSITIQAEFIDDPAEGWYNRSTDKSNYIGRCIVSELPKRKRNVTVDTPSLRELFGLIFRRRKIERIVRMPLGIPRCHGQIWIALPSDDLPGIVALGNGLVKFEAILEHRKSRETVLEETGELQEKETSSDVRRVSFGDSSWG